MKRTLIFFFCFSSFLLSAGEKRIVSLSPALTELLYVLEAGHMLAGRSNVCNYPEQVKNIPAAGAFASPNMEKTASLAPDLVIADTIWPPESEKLLRKLKCEVIVKKCQSVMDYLEWVHLLGEKLDRKAQAEKERLSVQSALAEIRKEQKAAGLRIVWLLSASPLIAAGPGSLPDDIIALTGGTNAAAKEGNKPYFRTSMEWLLKTDPDVIIILHSEMNMLKILQKQPAWKILKAVRNGRVIAEIPEDLLLRPGPRLVEGIRQLKSRLAKTP